MLDTLKQHIHSSQEFQKLLSSQPTIQVPHYISGITSSFSAFLLSSLFEKTSQSLIIILPTKDDAEKFRDDCSVLIDEKLLHLYTAEVFHQAEILDISSSLNQTETLQAISKNTRGIYFTHATALGFSIPPITELQKSVIEISVNKDIPFQQFIHQLHEMNFEKKQFVEGYGDFSVRGGIVDVFSYNGEHPLRIEFWGDTVESIREFDTLSQRSIRELQGATIVPNISTLKKEKKQSLLECFPKETLIFLYQPELSEKEFQEIESEGVQCDFSFVEIQNYWKQFPQYVYSTFHSSNSLDFHVQSQPPTNGSLKIFLEHLQKLTEQNFSITIASDTKESVQRIQELLEEEIEVAEQNFAPLINYSTESFHSGFIFPSAKIAFFAEHEIFGRVKQRTSFKKRRFKSISAKELQALQRGDFVTHVDHGIGKFLGLQKIKIGNTEQEVVKLEYSEKGTLFVNLNYIARLQKYSSAEGHVPKLSKLGTGEWEKLKARTKKKIKDIARDLILLYAKRKNEQGFAFQTDTHWQKEMEASFMYEDTPDQAKATVEVKQDMENSQPMDRLICGDVGFGKTEIAVRAAFKAVLNNKQVAVLVPTTILAQQHYATFTDRLHRYPVRIASLSRFKTAKEQKEVLQKLQHGEIDILIGTHRLLSKDIAFKDLGLLIIDEEQRFGVAAKEKLRTLKISVDTLTLTATPIPRTLNFSLMGARDLSIINTPPRNRLPIHTEIVQYDKKIIREAILHELHRGGQVFVVNDRIQNMETFTAMLQEYIPEAKFRIVHGQMDGKKLEEVMLDFLEKKFNVLVTTKIIESGVDIPSVNTIIINRADHFGLAELYQLRGRVGRSNIQAYSYLLVPPISSLPKTTLRRLQAIEEFTELGSGFNLAMRDLEIRGAGNMLGGEQSGFITEMGFEMYTKILEEAVSELKEQEFSTLFAAKTSATKLPETLIEADVDAYLPEFYIESDAERLDIYRRLYKATTEKEIQELRLELQDRFGALLEEAENVFALASLRLSASFLGFHKIQLQKHFLRLHFPPETEQEFYNSEFQKLMEKVGKIQTHSIQLKQEGKSLLLSIPLKNSEGILRMDEVRELLTKIKN